MRDIVLMLAITAGIGSSFFSPYAGLLVWVWYAIMYPQDGAYGFSRSLPLNFVIAAVAAFSWLISRSERKFPAVNLTLVLVIMFLAWVTINSFFVPYPAWSWVYWDRVWKIYACGLLAMVLTTNKVKFQALMWVAVISLSYWGLRGGMFTLTTGGDYHVFGPPDSEIGDNNDFALAITSMLPLLYYVRIHTASPAIRMAVVAVLGFDVLTVLGTYSRGGFVALSVLVVAAWLRTRNKLIYPFAAVIMIVPILHFMPQSFFDRINSINDYQTDGSFQGRVMAWHVAYDVAVDDFPFGAGFYAPQLSPIFNHYFPGAATHAAHSIYFQVLGEHGFIGLGIYLMMIASAFLNLRSVIRTTSKSPELAWANDLARMMQLSMLAFCVGGASMSQAYYDLFTLNICLSAALRELTRKALAPTRDRGVAEARPVAMPRPYVPAMKYERGIDTSS